MLRGEAAGPAHTTAERGLCCQAGRRARPAARTSGNRKLRVPPASLQPLGCLLSLLPKQRPWSVLMAMSSAAARRGQHPAAAVPGPTLARLPRSSSCPLQVSPQAKSLLSAPKTPSQKPPGAACPAGPEAALALLGGGQQHFHRHFLPLAAVWGCQKPKQEWKHAIFLAKIQCKRG